MLEKLRGVALRYEELCAKAEQPELYADPQKAARLMREKNDRRAMNGVCCLLM